MVMQWLVSCLSSDAACFPRQRLDIPPTAGARRSGRSNTATTPVSFLRTSPTSSAPQGSRAPLPPRSTRTHRQCQPAEIIVQWLGTQEQRIVHPQHGDQYTIVQEASERFTIQKG